MSFCGLYHTPEAGDGGRSSTAPLLLLLLLLLFCEVAAIPILRSGRVHIVLGQNSQSSWKDLVKSRIIVWHKKNGIFSGNFYKSF